jgi:pectate lyase
LNISYMNGEWGDRIASRQPRGQFGNVHMLTNYHHNGGGQIHGVGFEMAMIAAPSVCEKKGSIWTDLGKPHGWLGIGNIGAGSDLNDARGTVFDIPYDCEAARVGQIATFLSIPR